MGPVEAIVRGVADGQWYRFANPVALYEARTILDVLPTLAAVESRVARESLHAVGTLAYEAAPAFDPALAARPPGDYPLLWFALFGEPERLPVLPRPPAEFDGRLTWRASVDRAAFDAAIAKIREAIACGDTYQVNYTYRLHALFTGDPLDLFLALAHAQPGALSAYVQQGRYAVCSVSPELFVRREGPRVVSRPMKGTTARGRYPDEDRARAAWLGQSDKNRAENVMIVDMVRNDLGRVADVGSVVVERLFDIERLPSVWQMTSTVAARTEATLVDLLRATFPAASITGAPKASTMALIRELETEARNIYTGSVGWLAPGGRSQWSVAIRTVLIDRVAATAEYGVGGGIVWDSSAADEYDECVEKARVLQCAPPEFQLVETLRWTPGEGCPLLERHLDRLAASAAYFGWPVDRAAVRSSVEAAVAGRPAPSRVRVLLRADGALTIEVREAPVAAARPLRLVLAREPINSRDPFLFHKTTNRDVYTRASHDAGDADDVILWNERGEVTETTLGNLVVKLDGRLLTPPVTCGLLAGTFRASWLATGQVEEAVVTIDRLMACEALYRINAVRGMEPAAMVQRLPVRAV